MTAQPEPKTVDDVLEGIAKKHFNVTTLETRNADRLDFHDVAVWSIKAALKDAYDAGKTGLQLHVANLNKRPLTSGAPGPDQLSAHADKLVTEYAFGPGDQASSPDALTMARAAMLRYLLVKEMPKLVAQGKDPCSMTWREILPDFDVHNWYPSFPDDE